MSSEITLSELLRIVFAFQRDMATVILPSKLKAEERVAYLAQSRDIMRKQLEIHGITLQDD